MTKITFGSISLGRAKDTMSHQFLQQRKELWEVKSGTDYFTILCNRKQPTEELRQTWYRAPSGACSGAVVPSSLRLDCQLQARSLHWALETWWPAQPGHGSGSFLCLPRGTVHMLTTWQDINHSFGLYFTQCPQAIRLQTGRSDPLRPFP